MNTTRRLARRSILLVLALVPAMVSSACVLPDGDPVDAAALSDTSGDASAQPEEAPAPVDSSDDVDLGEITDPSETDDPKDPSDDIALGEITDPSETDDPDDPTDDVTPDSPTAARLRSEVQDFLRRGELALADEQATAVLEEEEGLHPELRLELEAYRDLARASRDGDDAAAGNALERLQRFEPEFVDELAVARVLPEGVLAQIDVGEAGAAAAPEGRLVEENPADDEAVQGAAQLDAVEKALAAGNWKLAHRLAEDALAGGKLTTEETTKAQVYEQLADAHTKADAPAIARATELLATLDPDLVRQLAPGAAAAAEPAARSDG